MKWVIVDIETYSDVDLKKKGQKNYIASEAFSIDLIGWVVIKTDSFNDLKKVDVNKLKFYQWESGSSLNPTLPDFNDKDTTWVAHNATFEINCFEKFFRTKMDLNKWLCTMVLSYKVGLPGALDTISKVLKLENHKKAGTSLINYFTKPCKPTKTNGYRTKNTPMNSPEKWQEYKTYNKFDVLATAELLIKVLCSFDYSENEHALWMLNQRMNSRGLRVDTKLIHAAIDYTKAQTEKINSKMKELTELENPNSSKQLQGWLQRQLPELLITSIDKEHIAELKNLIPSTDSNIQRVLDLRQMSSKTSLKKYETCQNLICVDNTFLYKGYLYNFLQFNGAGRTGRDAGRGVQIHNLPRNKLGSQVHEIRAAYRSYKRPITDNLTFELSQLLRTMFIPHDNHDTFIVADYSSIEAVVAAFIAGETWMLETFMEGKDLYKAMAMKMYELDSVREVTKELRQDGKVAVLACGYGGGRDAILSFAPDWDETKRQLIVDYYRVSNRKIVNTWHKLEEAAKYAIKNHCVTSIDNIISFKMKRGCLVCTLPSGRDIVYLRAGIKDNRIQYEYKTAKGKWGTLNTFGGKIFENIIQALSRDILMHALIRLDKLGYKIAFHVHDEVIIEYEAEKAEKELDVIIHEMCQVPEWARGMPLKAAGFITPYYMKEEED